MISYGLHNASTYPATTQKGVADLCLCQLAAMYVQMLGMSLFYFFLTYFYFWQFFLFLAYYAQCFLKVTQTLAACIASYLTITSYRYVLYIPKLYANIIVNYS